MKRWEYFTVTQNYHAYSDGLGGHWGFNPRLECRSVGELFEKLGLDGWELVTATSGPEWQNCYFKRPLP
jgi:hypothetical protein